MITRRINELLEQRQQLRDGQLGDVQKFSPPTQRNTQHQRIADHASTKVKPDRNGYQLDIADTHSVENASATVSANNKLVAPSAEDFPPLAPWTQVLGRKKQRKERKRMARSKTRSPNRQSQQRPQSTTQPTRLPRCRQPKTAAVTILSRDNRISYSDILREAKTKMDLKQLGIEETRIRRAITGGIIIEISGEQNSQKADILANTLRQTFTNTDDVTITRPAKRAKLRLSGLDDSTTTDDIRIALADIGKCSSQDIKTGNVRRIARGLGTIWVQCPLSAALIITA